MGQEFITRLNDGSIDSQMLIGLLDMGAKGLLLMAAAGLAAVAMRKHAAAARHLVWLLALCGLLLLPVVSVLMPKWTLPILPATQAPTTQEMAPISPPVEKSDLGGMVQAPSAPIAPPVTSVAQPTLPPAPPSLPMAETSPASSLKSISYPAWLLAIWLAVALLTLSPFAAGVVAVTRMRRRAESFADPDIQSLAATLAQTMGLKGTPRLLRGPIGAMPMATGFFTPAVFLPADAIDWAEEKCRAVLLHELAHVKRRDCLTHALARVATSLHWFNPLAWLALRQLRIEREHACDDLVLAAGERPSAYAENLLEIARTLHAKSVVSAAAITMAQKSQLEGRLLAVLDAARNRGRVTKTLFAASALCAITALALLASVNVARSESKGARAESSASNFELQYESGFTATLIGVTAGNTQHPDVAWEPGGTLLPTAPGPNAGVEFDVLEKGKVGRNFYMRIQADTDEQSTADFGVKFRVAPTDGGSLLSNGGPRTAPMFSTDFNEGLSTHRFELGIASGAWKSVAKSTFGKPTAGKVGDSDYVLLTTETYTRNGETRFSVTHSVKDREWRIVLFDMKKTMHKPIQNLSNGVNGMTQTEFTLRDIAPEEVERIELQVRDYEWKKFEGIAVNPNDLLSARKASQDLDESSPPATTVSASSNSATMNPPEEDTVVDASPYSLTRNASRIEARSDDRRVYLITTAQSLLRVDAPSIQIENREGDRIRLHVDGTATDRASIGVVMGSDGLNLQRLELIHGIAAQRPAMNTHYIVQRGWDKALVAIPTPILVPEAMTLTDEWRNWQQVKDGRKLEYVDPLGRKYVLHGLGWAQNGVKLFPVIPRLERFRSDGTLEGWTSFFEEMPEVTHFYETDGVTPAGRVLLRLSGIEGAPHVWNYTWRDSEGKYHQYDITPRGVIQYEALGKMGNIEAGQGFDMDSWVNQVDNGESSLEVSIDIDAVVKPFETAGRPDTPEKSPSPEALIDPTAQKNGSSKAVGLDGVEAESLARTIRAASPEIVEKHEEQANAEQSSAKSSDSPHSVFNQDYLGTLLEDPNLLTRIAGDAITPPAADTSWGPVVNGLQAAVRFKPEKAEYALGETIGMEFLARNIGPIPLEFLTSKWRNGDQCVVTDENGDSRPGGTALFSGINPVRRVKLAPGEVAAIESASFTIIPEASGRSPLHPVATWARSHAGIHKAQFRIHFPDSHMSSGKLAPKPGDWTGTLTTGERTIEFVDDPELFRAHSVFQIRMVAPKPGDKGSKAFSWEASNRPPGEVDKLWLLDEVLVGDGDLAAVTVVPGASPHQYAIEIGLNEKASERLALATGENIGHRMACMYQEMVYAAPTLNGPVGDGKLVVGGKFNKGVAESIVSEIREANALDTKAPFTQVSKESSLAPEIQVTIRHSGENCMIDFDTGELFTPPDLNGTENVFAWAAKNGIDLGGGIQGERRGLTGMDLLLNPEDVTAWDNRATNFALNNDDFKFDKPRNPVYFGATDPLPATWTFKTREGGRGIFQILGSDHDEPKAVRIRYRMLKEAVPASSVSDGETANSVE